MCANCTDDSLVWPARRWLDLFRSDDDSRVVPDLVQNFDHGHEAYVQTEEIDWLSQDIVQSREPFTQFRVGQEVARGIIAREWKARIVPPRVWLEQRPVTPRTLVWIDIVPSLRMTPEHQHVALGGGNPRSPPCERSECSHIAAVQVFSFVPEVVDQFPARREHVPSGLPATRIQVHDNADPVGGQAALHGPEIP
jgi:hypothetical protein